MSDEYEKKLDVQKDFKSLKEKKQKVPLTIRKIGEEEQKNLMRLIRREKLITPPEGESGVELDGVVLNVSDRPPLVILAPKKVANTLQDQGRITGASGDTSYNVKIKMDGINPDNEKPLESVELSLDSFRGSLERVRYYLSAEDYDVVFAKDVSRPDSRKSPQFILAVVGVGGQKEPVVAANVG